MAEERIVLERADEADREVIYRLRHAVFGEELGQYPVNAEGRLTDGLDGDNLYIVARRGTAIVGFVSVTPPSAGRYSIDRYFSRVEIPFRADETLYEVRLLVVLPPFRGTTLATLLMYAAARLAEAAGGTRIAGIGRVELLPFYRKFGLIPLGKRKQSGAVTYELMTASVGHLRNVAGRRPELLNCWEKETDWRLDFPFRPEDLCFHGGAFFEAIGPTFDALERSEMVINADVLDAWFPPAPQALSALTEYLPFLLRTSPPTDASGLVRTIAAARNLPADSLIVGAGSSALIFLAFREWLTPDSRVLLPDPTYGEYGHVLEKVIGCQVERFALSRENDFQIDLAAFAERLRRGRFDLAVLVNPNNPTGRHLPRRELELFLRHLPPKTRLWLDEAYIDYIGGVESLETFASASENVVVCKSLSKGYALSGARAAYLCGSPAVIGPLRGLIPPWAIGLPTQVAAVAALRAPSYYAERYRETQKLRRRFVARLREELPAVTVLEGSANFVLCYLPETGPDAATICELCRLDNIFLRDAGAASHILGRRALHITVKEIPAQERILTALTKSVVGRRSVGVP